MGRPRRRHGQQLRRPGDATAIRPPPRRGLGRRELTLAPVVLRPATAADADLLLDWANDPLTRGMGFHPEPILHDQHMEWLAARLASPTTRLLLGEMAGVPVGQVRFEQDQYGVAEVGISVAPDARGRGIGRQVLEAGLAAAKADPTFAPTGFLARVRPDNVPSLALFRGAGFVEIRRELVKALPCVVLRRD